MDGARSLYFRSHLLGGRRDGEKRERLPSSALLCHRTSPLGVFTGTRRPSPSTSPRALGSCARKLKIDDCLLSTDARPKLRRRTWRKGPTDEYMQKKERVLTFFSQRDSVQTDSRGCPRCVGLFGGFLMFGGCCRRVALCRLAMRVMDRTQRPNMAFLREEPETGSSRDRTTRKSTCVAVKKSKKTVAL